MLKFRRKNALAPAGVVRLAFTGIVVLAGCFRAPPMRIDEGWVLQQLSSRYREFFPRGGSGSAAGPAAAQSLPVVEDAEEQGLLRPRFGLPAVIQTGTSFSIELLEKKEERREPKARPRVALLRPEVTAAAAAACLDGTEVPGCHVLRVEILEKIPLSSSRSAELVHARYTAHLTGPVPPPPGGYDLWVSGDTEAPEGLDATRAPRAVWLRQDDPTLLRQVKVAHLSDLHIGKGGQLKAAQILDRLRAIVGDVNRLSPDLVIVTGDIVNSGQQPQLWPIAQELLEDVAAPVLVVLGNHDIEFMQRGMRPVRRYGAGWSNFARTFHPFLHFSLSLGGYDFVGFDSGPAERTPRILTRGLHPSSVALLRADILHAQERGQRGVILFSHAPSRASTFTNVAPRSAGFFGRMRYGNAAFEGLLVEAAARGQRVLHLAGHTHWSDVFELDPPTRQFLRWPVKALSPCPRPLRSPVALITTQAAGHSGLFSKANAQGYGFALLTLGGKYPEIEVFRYGTRKRALLQCPEKGIGIDKAGDNRATRLADTSLGSKML